MILKRLQVKTTQVGLLTNSYVICDEDTKEAMVIDPAGDVDTIIEMLDILKANGNNPETETTTPSKPGFGKIEILGVGSVSDLSDILSSRRIYRKLLHYALRGSYVEDYGAWADEWEYSRRG